jgi:DeoR family transcriptional regulator, aga operon transcriptional repressor
VGPFAEATLQKVALDLAFIGVNGADPTLGPTVNDEGEATVNSLMARRASEAYMVADSSKIGQRSFATMSGFVFRNLITDAGITAAHKTAFETSGVKVIIAR